ncbi:hypothetical protein [Candidatus Aciduliprofundum boonei]|uniref:Uncharacterized protein n=1 Tax=Aciduliprofundum boonei (strain DSM 19572 / T469) TaxID=439481 RepID=B5I9W4_ACIB4|nr:hypothetical protein [Candidatus Aciduliprofundum boonei]ADD08403.1 hypothetical protein Aboo_0592 [Aciduliprofundum boonei T469]EDY36674.1 hypothetical protein ABOONEI_1595 [Aciduliprofundum boonei T469]HII55447.1 hypothetical protein [Candidatus Aciduliprofundum boonei]
MDREIKDKVDYLTSTKMLRSDKYGIWGLDIVGVVVGMLLLIWGIVNFEFSWLWKATLIIIGIILLSVCSVRIERRYEKFKRDIMSKI